MISNYVAFDVETPNALNDRMCSVGIVRVINGFVEEEVHYLINPETHFDPLNIQIHGITPEMVEHAPTFKELWPEIEHFFDGEILVAHNAGFDVGILQKTLMREGIYAPRFPYYCTVTLSKKAFPEAGRHNLKAMSHFLDIELLHHHNALYDAKCCQEIFEKAQRRLKGVGKDLRLYRRTLNPSVPPSLQREMKEELKELFKKPSIDGFKDFYDHYEIYIDAHPFSDILWKIEKMIKENNIREEDILILKTYIRQ